MPGLARKRLRALKEKHNMRKENQIYKVDAEKDEQPSTFDEIKEIYQRAAKMEPITFDDTIKKMQAMEEIEKFMAPSIIRMWQEEAEADRQLTERLLRLYDLLEDATINEYPDMEAF
jgi:hypothetical protein